MKIINTLRSRQHGPHSNITFSWSAWSTMVHNWFIGLMAGHCKVKKSLSESILVHFANTHMRHRFKCVKPHAPLLDNVIRYYNPQCCILAFIPSIFNPLCITFLPTVHKISIPPHARMGRPSTPHNTTHLATPRCLTPTKPTPTPLRHDPNVILAGKKWNKRRIRNFMNFSFSSILFFIVCIIVNRPEWRVYAVVHTGLLGWENCVYITFHESWYSSRVVQSGD